MLCPQGILYPLHLLVWTGSVDGGVNFFFNTGEFGEGNFGTVSGWFNLGYLCYKSLARPIDRNGNPCHRHRSFLFLIPAEVV